ncbi:MAG TPA: T9SS type A sorting domain-containing protein [Flavipsychrobacter sp.]|nr:T9SS type A sorting domain-containing protein [Flavipsychrobacter sp.]
MKKQLLLLSCSILAISSYAQETAVKSAPAISNASFLVPSDGGPSEKTTGLSDTLFYGTQAQFNGPYLNLNMDYAVPFDSGRLYGTNVAGFKGFAQLYRYNNIDAAAPQDTTYNIIGVFSRWFGRVQTGSTKNVNFNVWQRSNSKTAVANRSKFFISGAPQATAVASRTVPFTGLSLTAGTTTYFTTPLNAVTYDVYVGYTVSYNWAALGGDTVGLRSTQTGGTSTYTLEPGTGDTLVSARNLIQDPSNAWRSVVFDLGITNGGDQVIFPIIRLSCPTCFPTDVKGISNKNLTFHGNYPNPAVNQTTIKFTLSNPTDVTVTVYDLNGRTLNTIAKTGLSSGVQEMVLPTGNLSNGNYLYTIETKDGGAVAVQFSVAK